jgi:recombination associated protein RdgC
MTWYSKISSVLDESLAVKSIKLLGVLTGDSRGTVRNDDERFDGDFALMAGYLDKMLADLVEALVGKAGGADPGDQMRTAPAGISRQKIERAAKVDEPVREQRSVTDHGPGDVPADDGSASAT